MENIFLSYYKLAENSFGRYKILLKEAFVLFLAVISGIYINLFTNSPNMTNFFGINLSTIGELWFALAFGLISLLSIIRAFFSIVIIGLIAIVTTFILYLVSKLYRKILEVTNIISKPLGLILLVIVEFVVTLFLLWQQTSVTVINASTSLNYLIAFFMLWLGILTAKEFSLSRNSNPKIYNLKRLVKNMPKKLFTIFIFLLALIGVILAWNLADKFSLLADFKYIEIIITTAVFLSGFGLLALDKKDSVFFINVKQIIGWSMLSIVCAFCYIIFEETGWARMYFALSSGFLFFTILLVLLLVLFHDNKYLKDMEKKNG